MATVAEIEASLSLLKTAAARSEEIISEIASLDATRERLVADLQQLSPAVADRERDFKEAVSRLDLTKAP